MTMSPAGWPPGPWPCHLRLDCRVHDHWPCHLQVDCWVHDHVICGLTARSTTMSSVAWLPGPWPCPLQLDCRVNDHVICGLTTGSMTNWPCHLQLDCWVHDHVICGLTAGSMTMSPAGWLPRDYSPNTHQIRKYLYLYSVPFQWKAGLVQPSRRRPPTPVAQCNSSLITDYHELSDYEGKFTIFAVFNDFGQRASVEPDVRCKVINKLCCQVRCQVDIFRP